MVGCAASKRARFALALAVGLVHALVGWHVGEWPAGADGWQVERPRAVLCLGELEHVGQFADALIRVHCLFLSFFACG